MPRASHAVEPPLAAKVQVIGHRGACALRPEHTLASYLKAIDDGADFIEPDLVMSRDGVLLARHENEIGGTTDVAAHPEFAARRTRKTIDGRVVEGWFTEDFSLAELRSLRARERLPQWRGTAFDGQFPIVTFAEILDAVAARSAACGRVVGIIPEIKHGTHFRRLGLPLEDALLDALAAHAYTRTAPVEIQSFEVANLQYLRERLRDGARPNLRLLQLLDDDERVPADVAAAGGTRSYAQMRTPEGLRAIAAYADAVGPQLRAIIPVQPDGRLAAPTTLVRDAHAAGLEVHAYTFRPENHFLPAELWQGSDPGLFNRDGSVAEIRRYLDAGIDAFFTDDPASGRLAVDGY